jgi:hypothetical protein
LPSHREDQACPVHPFFIFYNIIFLYVSNYGYRVSGRY